jgi:hypothetical protein
MKTSQAGKEDDGRETWENARALAALYDPVPSFLSSVVRILRCDSEEAPSGELSRLAIYCLKHLLRIGSIRGFLHSATETFFQDQLDPELPISGRTLTKCFSSRDIAVLLAVLTLYRGRLRRLPVELQEELSKRIHLSAEIGGRVGQAIPSVGFAQGLLVGITRPIALSILREVDFLAWTQYRKTVSNLPYPYDERMEIEQFGCSHGQVAGMLLQNAGMGVQTAEYIAEALRDGDISDIAGTRSVMQLRVASVWTESLQKRGEIPQLVHRVEYYPVEEQLRQLLAFVAERRTNGSVNNMLDRNFLPKSEVGKEVEDTVEDDWDPPFDGA